MCFHDPPERRPLLGPKTSKHVAFDDPAEPDLTEPQLVPTKRNIWPKFTVTDRRFRFVPLIGCLIIFVNEAEYYLKQISSMRAIEAMYCIEYWQEIDPEVAAMGKHIPETMCKAHDIQKNLAETQGMIMFFRMLCAMIGAIPLGAIADKRGRKLVLVLHKVNVFLSCGIQLAIYLLYPLVPIWLLLFSGIPGIIGGNFDLGLAMLFAAYTDVMPDAGQRATLFFVTSSMVYIAQATCPLVGAWLMNLDGKGGTPEIAMGASLASAVLCIIITAGFFPETLQKTQSTGDEPEWAEDSDDELEAERSKASDAAREECAKQELFIATGIRNIIAKKINNVRTGVKGIGISNILLLGLAIFCTTTGIKSNDWYALVQYPVIKLKWTFPEASLVVSVQGVITLINFAFILPAFSAVGFKYLGAVAKANMLIMGMSSTLLTLGSIGIGFSATNPIFMIGTVVYTLGAGLPVATQAFVASLMDKSRLARVMAVLSIAATAGKVVASGVFPQILALGLDSGIEVLKGLPFFATAVLFLVAGCCVISVGLKTTRAEAELSEQL